MNIIHSSKRIQTLRPVWTNCGSARTGFIGSVAYWAECWRNL